MGFSYRAVRVSLLAIALSSFVNPPARPQAPGSKKLKIYISVDMEGVAGVVTAGQLGPGGLEYGRFRHFMTHETRAAVSAATQSGVAEIMVIDSHGIG